MGLAELWKMPRWRAPASQVSASERLRGLVAGHFDFIGRSLRRLGVPAADVDDATQQVFMVVSRRLDEVEAGRERAFLFGVALRVASDVRRARRRRGAVMDEGANDVDGATPDPSPEQLTDQRQARALLDEALEALSLDLRTVFVLFELEEMTMAEIAALLDLPPGTVASRLRRAREAFQEQCRRLRARVGEPTP